MRAPNMMCTNCGANLTAATKQVGSLTLSLCRECGLTLGASDSVHERRGFLARLSRFGLGARSQPLFREQGRESSR